MTKIFLFLNDDEAKSQIVSLLDNETELIEPVGEIEDCFVQINNSCPDIILIENTFSNCEFLIRQIKSDSRNQNVQILFS